MEDGVRKNLLPFDTAPEILINGDWHLVIGTVNAVLNVILLLK